MLICILATISPASKTDWVSSSSPLLSLASRVYRVLGCFTLNVSYTCANGMSIACSHLLEILNELYSANGYYSSFTYFSSKVLFDILPLRVVPPFVFGAIAYPLIGLVPSAAIYWKFMLVLVLFNLTTASVCLLLSVAFENLSVASLVGTLVMLFK